MKKLVILSKESIFSGYMKCGMAEVADCLANSMSDQYNVTLIVLKGHSRMPELLGTAVKEIEPGVEAVKFAKVQYYMVNEDIWDDKAVSLINDIAPDIFHNLDDPSIIDKLAQRPEKTLFTFDSIEFASQYESYLSKYDHITSNAKSQAGAILRSRSMLGATLSQLDFQGISPGILTQYFTPTKGLLIPAPYGFNSWQGKNICKKRLLQSYNIQGDPPVFLTMCRLVQEKGLDYVIDAAELIGLFGGVLIVVGIGDEYYERAFTKLAEKYAHVIYIKAYASVVRLPPFLAGADFYLQPSFYESAGLMPMTALSYGTIPIISIVGGLYDSFNEENCIAIQDNDVQQAIRVANKIYRNKEELNALRNTCISQDISWETRKQPYVDLYEK